MPWNDERPMSPHLQIYDLPITAKLSILHRATGAVLLFGMLLIVIVLMALAMGEQSWVTIYRLLNNWFGISVLLGLTFSVYYHFCTGIRHLLWDTGKYMEKDKQVTSGLIIIATSIILTASTWWIAWVIA
jgi:succinate dehydrogenase cytochrome b subunit